MTQNTNSSGKNNHQKSVWVYLAILFVVAMGLILFSLAMHNRGTISAATALVPFCGGSYFHLL